MREIELLLKALQAANLATPGVVALINAIKGGVDAGWSDDDILAHAAEVAQETKRITEEDMSDRP